MKTWKDSEELIDMFVLFGKSKDRASLWDLIVDVKEEAIKEANKK